MNIHIPKWLIYGAIGAFALFEVVTHAPPFLNAFGTQQAQQQQNLATQETALRQARANASKAEAEAAALNANPQALAGSEARLRMICRETPGCKL